MTSMSWKENVSDEQIIKVINEKFKFTNMTPVQKATIPVFSNNKDVCVEAVTGSGKTLAFIVPMLQTLKKKCQNPKKSAILSLILSPTRELAIQIHQDLAMFLDGENFTYSSQMFIGGQGDIQKDVDKFNETGGQIIIGTPGRIAYLCRASTQVRSSLKQMEVLILDEADRLLGPGFHRSTSEIFSYLPKQRRTGLFSATLTDEVDQLIKAGLRDPVKIIVKEKTFNCEGSARTPQQLSNKYVVCSETNKFNKLVTFLSRHKDGKIIVFFATCASVDYFGRALKELLKNEVNIFSTHGKLKKTRNKIFEEFRKVEKGVLMCTNVMSRGIDIQNIDWVLQYDPPSEASDFVHRCGRTARIGKSGSALLFLLEAETSYVNFLSFNQKAPMQERIFDDESDEWLEKLRKLSLDDRAFIDSAKRAFVSFIRFYKKHECSLIFRYKDLNLGRLATGYGLVVMPNMPELRDLTVTDFVPLDADVLDKIKFKNQQREKQRQENMKRPAPERPKMYSKKSKSWSDSRLNKEDKKVKKQLKREKRQRRKENQMKLDHEDLEELGNDANLMKKLEKKLKSKKITKAEYEVEIEKIFNPQQDEEIQEKNTPPTNEQQVQ